MFTQDFKHKHTKPPPTTTLPSPIQTSHSSPTHGSCPDLLLPLDSHQRQDSSFLKHKRPTSGRSGSWHSIVAHPNDSKFKLQIQSQLSCSWCGENMSVMFKTKCRSCTLSLGIYFQWSHRLQLPLEAHIPGILVQHAEFREMWRRSPADVARYQMVLIKTTTRVFINLSPTEGNISPAALLRRLLSQSASLSQSRPASPAAPAADSPPSHLRDGHMLYTRVKLQPLYHSKEQVTC